MIGNPLKLSPGFPPLHTGHATFTASGVPSSIVSAVIHNHSFTLAKLSTVDRYSCDSFTFSSHGYDLHIDNELVAEAFASLPKDEQSILILRFVLDLTDEEIGRLMGMSRSAVQRHRTSTLKDLRIKLMAFMPEGG